MTRRQGAVSELLIGASSQRAILRRPMANRPGPLSVGWGRPGASISEGSRQYGLSAVRDWFEPAVDESRSTVTPVIDNFSIARTCSCDALIVLNMLRANQTPAIKNES
jgi:hypothetical protein